MRGYTVLDWLVLDRALQNHSESDLSRALARIDPQVDLTDDRQTGRIAEGYRRIAFLVAAHNDISPV